MININPKHKKSQMDLLNLGKFHPIKLGFIYFIIAIISIYLTLILIGRIE